MIIAQDDKVKIREFCIDDIENKVKWINDKNNNKYLHYDIPLCVEKTIAWFGNKAKNRLDCIIEYDDVPIGLIGLIGIDETNKKAEFYITIGNNEFKRKGIAFNATNLILNYAFEQLGLIKIYLNVDEDNVAACNLYEKVGFVLEGRFIKDLYHNDGFINRLRYSKFYEGE